jgi:hypothetical protein
MNPAAAGDYAGMTGRAASIVQAVMTESRPALLDAAFLSTYISQRSRRLSGQAALGSRRRPTGP